MRTFICCVSMLGWSFILHAEINIDSIYVARYTKTLNDSVFVIGDLIHAPEIHFPMSEFQVDSALLLLADFYTRNPFLITELIVHTDSRGDLKPNQELSFRRAHAAVVYLVNNGNNECMLADRMRPVGKGESQLLIAETYIDPFIHDKETVEWLHSINRRTEIKVTGFLGKNFYKNQPKPSSEFDRQHVRNSAYYEDLILIADRALLDGDYHSAFEFYSYAAAVAPANETYAVEQRNKVKAILEEKGY